MEQDKKVSFSPEEFCQHTGYTQSIFYKYIARFWEELCEKCDDKKPFFAEKSYYKKWHLYVNDSPDILRRMEEVEKILDKDPIACFLANILRYGIFEREEYTGFGGLPNCEKIFGENMGIFNLLIAESHFPTIQKAWQKLGLGDEYLTGPGKWLNGTIKIYAEAHNGLPGHTLSQCHWVNCYGANALFRIGRFEFQLHNYIHWMVPVYVNKNNVALAFHKDGSWVNKDGLRMYKETEGFKKVFLREENGFVTGCPILPDGSSHPDQYISLSLDEWHALCHPWEIVPSVHIPGGERMDKEEVNDTFRKANKFFQKYFHFTPKLYGCYSWILNPDLREFLPNSNVCHFQMQGYQFPAWGGITPGQQDGVFFVFGREGSQDLENLPCHNKMEEAMVNIYKKKGLLRSGALFILSADGEKVGKEYYLSNMDVQKKIVEENLCPPLG